MSEWFRFTPHSTYAFFTAVVWSVLAAFEAAFETDNSTALIISSVFLSAAFICGAIEKGREKST